MVLIKTKYGDYDYSGKSQDLTLINKNIKEDISKFCKGHQLSKSKLVEEFYKTILLRFREGNLNKINAYITINVLSNNLKKVKLNKTN